MPIVFSSLYEALRSANVPRELAEKAALVKDRADKKYYLKENYCFLNIIIFSNLVINILVLLLLIHS
jgi:hypothetical protein